MSDTNLPILFIKSATSDSPQSTVWLDEHQLADRARVQAWQSLFPLRKWWSRWLDLQLPKLDRRCRRAGSAPPGWCAAFWSWLCFDPTSHFLVRIWTIENLRREESATGHFQLKILNPLEIMPSETDVAPKAIRMDLQAGLITGSWSTVYLDTTECYLVISNLESINHIKAIDRITWTDE